MKTFVATKNEGKLREIRQLLAGSSLELETYPAYRDVEENAQTYVANALIKARALAEQLREEGVEAAVLADDSGIEVDALDGRPGVLSARYAGVETAWPERLAMLLREVSVVPADLRTARFVCVMAYVEAGRDAVASLGIVEGVLVEPRGSSGFGYDPIFYYPPFGRTFGEVSEEKKNSASHRRRAADALLAALRARV